MSRADEEKRFDAAEAILRATYLKGLVDLYVEASCSVEVGDGLRREGFLALQGMSLVHCDQIIGEPRAFVGSVLELLKDRPGEIHKLIEIDLDVESQP